VFAEYAPQGREAKDAFAYYRLLQRFLALLKDRHTRVELPREPKLAGFVDVPPVWLEAVGRRALVADVEAENGGGSTGQAARVARHLLSTPAQGSIWRTREHRGAYRALGHFAGPGNWAEAYKPRTEGRQWFHGEHGALEPAAEKEGRLLVPTIVLTSWNTGSAAEDFLVYLDREPRATRVGGRTAARASR
jgi:hypothetical protein